MNSGRYYIKYPNGRTFCVEPIRERNQKEDDCAFTNGGTDGTTVKNKSEIEGGSILREESIITKENGYKNIIELPKGTSPDYYIDKIVKGEL